MPAAAVAGTVNVTGVPLALVGELKVPPAGLAVQVTPEKSLVVAVSDRCWVRVTPACVGVTDTEMPEGLMVSFSVTLLVCALLLESVTMKVSGIALALVLGVPLIAPLAALSVRPVGSVPAVSVHDRGLVPPLAASVAL